LAFYSKRPGDLGILRFLPGRFVWSHALWIGLTVLLALLIRLF
jgi:hypothetical protein